jgi:hypothetical protein
MCSFSARLFAKHMATGTNLRSGLMITPVGVAAGRASRAVGLGRLVRGVALGALRVHGHTVKRGEPILRMTRGARRRARRTTRTVGTMARVAPPFHVLVRAPLLVRMAGNATRRYRKEGARMRLMTTCAGLMPLGCAGLFLCVAAPAGERDCGLVRRGSMTRRAVTVSSVGSYE